MSPRSGRPREAVFARGHQRHLIGLHPAGAVEVEGEAGIPSAAAAVSSNGNFFQAAPMPVIRCEAYSFVPSAPATPRPYASTRAGRERLFECLPLCARQCPQRFSPALAMPTVPVPRRIPRSASRRRYSVPHFVAVGQPRHRPSKKGVPLPADLHGRRRAEHEFARRTVGRNLHVAEPVPGIPRTQGDPCPWPARDRRPRHGARKPRSGKPATCGRRS